MAALDKSGQTLKPWMITHKLVKEDNKPLKDPINMDMYGCKKNKFICVPENIFKTKLIFQIQIFETYCVLLFLYADCHHLEDSD